MARDPIDPKGLIRESFRIIGITPAECRSIFLDWALSVPASADTASQVQTLLVQYAAEPADHPMMQVLKAAAGGPSAAKRRGGRAGRQRES